MPSDALEVCKLFTFDLFSLTELAFCSICVSFFFATDYVLATEPTLLLNHGGSEKYMNRLMPEITEWCLHFSSHCLECSFPRSS